MRIGIEINGVLRNTVDKFEKTYQKFMIDKTDGMEEEGSFEYKITLPITSLDLKSHFTFQNDADRVATFCARRLGYPLEADVAAGK